MNWLISNWKAAAVVLLILIVIFDHYGSDKRTAHKQPAPEPPPIRTVEEPERKPDAPEPPPLPQEPQENRGSKNPRIVVSRQMPEERGIRLKWFGCTIIPDYGARRYDETINVQPGELSGCYRIRPNYWGRMHKKGRVTTYWSNGAITNYEPGVQNDLGDIKNAAFKLESFADKPVQVRVMLCHDDASNCKAG